MVDQEVTCLPKKVMSFSPGIGGPTRNNFVVKISLHIPTTTTHAIHITYIILGKQSFLFEPDTVFLEPDTFSNELYKILGTKIPDKKNKEETT